MKPVYEIVERDAFCRVCDKQMKRGEDKAVKFYSHRNRGQNILICESCVRDLNKLVEGEI